MDTTTIFNYHKTPLSTTPLLNILMEIKREKYKFQVDKLRQFYLEDVDENYDQQKRIMSYFSVSGSFTEENEKAKLVDYSQYIALELIYLNEEDMTTVKAKLACNEYVISCFTSALGFGLTIIVKTKNKKTTKHQWEFLRMAKYFNELIGMQRISTYYNSLYHTYLIPSDPDLYLNLGAKSFPETDIISFASAIKKG